MNNPGSDDYFDTVLGAINKYEDHPSIVKIKEFFPNQNVFSFSHTNHEGYRIYYRILK